MQVLALASFSLRLLCLGFEMGPCYIRDDLIPYSLQLEQQKQVFALASMSLNLIP